MFEDKVKNLDQERVVIRAGKLENKIVGENNNISLIVRRLRRDLRLL